MYDEGDRRARRRRAAHDDVVAASLRADRTGRSRTFSAEFALHQSLPIYAGNLGVLAGDYCKEASDLGIPLIGVGSMVSAVLLAPERVARKAGSRSCNERLILG